MTNRKLIHCALLAFFILFFDQTALFGAARPAAAATGAAAATISLPIAFVDYDDDSIKETFIVSGLSPDISVLALKQRIQVLKGFEGCFQELAIITSGGRHLLEDNQKVGEISSADGSRIELSYYGEPTKYTLFVILPSPHRVLALGGVQDQGVEDIKDSIESALNFAGLEALTGEQLKLYSLNGNLLADDDEVLIEDEGGCAIIFLYKVEEDQSASPAHKMSKIIEADKLCVNAYTALQILNNTTKKNPKALYLFLKSFLLIKDKELSLFGYQRYRVLCKSFIPLLERFVEDPACQGHLKEIDKLVDKDPKLPFLAIIPDKKALFLLRISPDIASLFTIPEGMEPLKLKIPKEEKKAEEPKKA